MLLVDALLADAVLVDALFVTTVLAAPSEVVQRTSSSTLPVCRGRSVLWIAYGRSKITAAGTIGTTGPIAIGPKSENQPA